MTTALQHFFRAVQSHCSRPISIPPKFFKNIIGIPRGRTSEMYESSHQQFLDQILTHALTAQEIGKKKRQTSIGMLVLSRASSEKKRVLDHKNWTPQFITSGIPVEKIFETILYAVIHFGDVPAECVARVVRHDQTILYERPSEVAYIVLFPCVLVIVCRLFRYIQLCSVTWWLQISSPDTPVCVLFLFCVTISFRRVGLLLAKSSSLRFAQGHPRMRLFG